MENNNIRGDNMVNYSDYDTLKKKLDKLDELIKQGEKFENQIMGNFLNGLNFEKWKSACVIFLDKNFKNNPGTARFKALYDSQDIKDYHSMLGILKAIEQTESE